MVEPTDFKIYIESIVYTIHISISIQIIYTIHTYIYTNREMKGVIEGGWFRKTAVEKLDTEKLCSLIMIIYGCNCRAGLNLQIMYRYISYIYV